jgi:hypothetical protein
MRKLRQPRRPPPWLLAARPWIGEWPRPKPYGASAPSRKCWRRLAVVACVGVVAHRVDRAFPGDHVVEAGGQPGIAGPHDAVDRRAEAVGDAALMADGAAMHLAGIGVQPGMRHAGRVEDAGAQQGGEILAGAALDDLRQDAEILVDVGIAGAGREMQRGDAGDQVVGVALAEHALDRRAAQHRQRPVVAHAGLVVAQIERARRRLAEPRQQAAHIGVEHGGVGELVEQQRAGELLGDRADQRQGLRGVWDARLRVGPAPDALADHLAVAQNRRGAAGAGVALGQCVERGVEA